MSLDNKLAELRNGLYANIPEDVLALINQGNTDLIEAKFAENSIDVGEQFPDFTLTNAQNQQRTLDQLLEGNEYLVISYYRGGWCPFCNLELQALQGIQEQLAAKSAGLVAISPELPDNSLSTSEKNSLNFEVLTDQKLALAEQLRIAFELPDYLKPVYQNFGLDLKALHGDDREALPIPITLIINKDKQVIYRYANVEYAYRLEPEEILKQLG